MRTPSFLAATSLLLAAVLADNENRAATGGIPFSAAALAEDFSHAQSEDIVDDFNSHCGSKASDTSMTALLCVFISKTYCGRENGDLPFCEECGFLPQTPTIPFPEEIINACVEATQDYHGGVDNVEFHDHEWRIQNPSECSETCGTPSGTYTVEVVVCVRNDDKVVKDKYCNAKTKPEKEHTCMVRPTCDDKKDKSTRYKAIPGPWESCSASCGTGVQRRERHCLNRNGRETYASKCGRSYFDPDIPVGQACNTHACGDYVLGYSTWSACSQKCTKNGIVGTSTRKVTCYETNGPGERATALDDLKECEDAGLVVEPLTMPCNTFSKCNFEKKKKRGFGEGFNTETTVSAGLGMIAVGGVAVAGVAVRRRRRKEAELLKLIEEEGATPGASL